jgi:type IV secretion system protein VirB3|tara:strand:+ start:1306 stop:1647 length:342 start_codon:yes stop_codon:yes gene_type:complete
VSEPVFLTEDPLSLALTRPALWFGVPVEATMMIASFSAVILMIFGNPIIAIAIGGAILLAARFIVRSDYNMFRILQLYMRTKAGPPNKGVWGGSSYSPLPIVGTKRKGFRRGW